MIDDSRESCQEFEFFYSDMEKEIPCACRFARYVTLSRQRKLEIGKYYLQELAHNGVPGWWLFHSKFHISSHVVMACTIAKAADITIVSNGGTESYTTEFDDRVYSSPLALDLGVNT